MNGATLGLGGNLGDPIATLEVALARLPGAGVTVISRSGFYRTPPWGPVTQPDFINACAVVETSLSPRQLLSATQALERDLGRRPGERWGPRSIDIDILDYGDVALDEPGLMLPHPRLFERAFVLVPLAEIAPDRLIAGRAVRDWAASVDRSGIERI